MAPQSSESNGAETHYHLGLAELHQYLFHFKEAALPRAVKAFERATVLEAGNASYWTAFGFALDAQDLPGEAIVALRQAHQLDPEDEQVEVFVLTLLSELGPEPEAMAAVEAFAERKGINLASYRKQLAEADMPVNARALVMNGFVRARNFLRSTLEDAI